MAFSPLFDIIVLSPPPQVETTAGGIFLPSEVRPDSPSEGEVVAVGLDVSCVQPGDKVVYKKFSPVQMKIEGVDYLLARESDILIKLF